MNPDIVKELGWGDALDLLNERGYLNRYLNGTSIEIGITSKGRRHLTKGGFTGKGEYAERTLEYARSLKLTLYGL